MAPRSPRHAGLGGVSVEGHEAGRPVEAEDLDGEWTGTMTLASVHGGLEQIETMRAPYVGPARSLCGDAVPSPRY